MGTVLVFAYILSYIFTDENKIMIIVQALFILIGMPAAFILSVLISASVLDKNDKTEEFKLTATDLGFKFIPLYNIISTLLMISLIKESGNTTAKQYWNFHCLGSWLLMVISTSLLCTFLIWLFEKLSANFKNERIEQVAEIAHSPLKDNDVIQEEEKVQQQSPYSVAVHVTGARKSYDNVLAVKNVSFSVSDREIFALLGVNGAGKTTMFKLMTLQVKPDCGRFYIRGINMHSDESAQVKKFVGYCPQNDVLLDYLTVKEHLNFYATIKGIPDDIKPKIVNNMIDIFNFGENENKKVLRLSEGSKRKLCTAIALLGHPEILLLDEPTTGLDPQNKRAVWDAIRQQVSGEINTAVILSTHSMEEVEALSTKVAIMVSGNFRCFGSNQHLKSKYGDSYDVEFTVAQPIAEAVQSVLRRFEVENDFECTTLASAQAFLKQINMNEEAEKLVAVNPRALYIFQSFDSSFAISAASLVEFGLVERKIRLTLNSVKNRFTNYKSVEETAMKLKLQIPKIVNERKLTFGDLFRYAEELKVEGYISDYAIYETTLEHIFQYFAKQID